MGKSDFVIIYLNNSNNNEILLQNNTILNYMINNLESYLCGSVRLKLCVLLHKPFKVVDKIVILALISCWN